MKKIQLFLAVAMIFMTSLSFAQEPSKIDQATESVRSIADNTRDLANSAKIIGQNMKSINSKTADALKGLQEPAKSTGTGFGSTLSSGTDRVYTDGTNAVSTVYSDIKSLGPKGESAIREMAKSLKTGTKELWRILVNQQRVWSWCYLVGFIITFVSWCHFYHRFKNGSNNAKANDGDWLSGDIWISLFTGAMSIGLSVLAATHLVPMMTGFLNPEFGAMQNIIQVALSLK